MAKFSFISYLFFLFAAVLCAGVEASYGRIPTRVKEGQSIQRAINRAQPGDTILVGKGTYREQITISKDGIRLIGDKAILRPPVTAPKKPNGCVGLAGDGTAAGICIIGPKVKLDPFPGQEHRKVASVDRAVRDVRVEGFEVRDFQGLNIAIVGAKNTEVKHNTVVDGTAYGILTVGSVATRITGNKVSSSSLLFIGICMDDKSDTNGARVSHNTVRNCCAGAFVDPGIDGARVTDNRISDSNPFCPSAGGVSIAGATNTKVSGNKISGITDNGKPELISSGIAIFDFLGRVASNNVVVNNVLKKNDQDLLVDTTGANNKVANNNCATPEALCKK
ncbi:conserved hypothetical protein [Verticillium alfalfae VaMs.102]|uniref:Right handed beta helix domain-containing protein n=1 Tax=Verticillium alfalfae (strain VaMs.102 / ATCC MYA-4576 / FGSC 10136) TaxID=526221 RepID=C9SFN6_VERA1|nr:conserved hypothetical protein [Verticillium alfalfae VaMs.102]EEY17981.1 conserved hypothetical protein [Verticillium alfalfae VaMs.102]